MTKRKRRTFTPKFKAEVVLESLHKDTSQVELCQRHNISEEQLSTWKQQLLNNAPSLFKSRDKPSKADTKRIAELEKFVGKLSVAVDIQKKVLNWVERHRSEKRQIVEALETDSSIRQIWGSLGFNRSSLRFREFRGLGKRLCGEGIYLNSQGGSGMSQ